VVTIVHVKARVFWLPKAGNRAEEYEDAYWPARGGRRGAARVRFAVADGATETSFAGLWARLLVHDYGSGELDLAAPDGALAAAQTRWREDVLSRPLPWYAEEKALHGAYAALLGLELAPGKRKGPGRWRCQSVGDCCLAQLRDDVPLVTFPAADATFFTSRPFLLSSNPVHNAALGEHLQQREGSCQAGDTFYLMTDALAVWALQGAGGDAQTWLTLRQVARPGGGRAFAAWVQELRRDGEMRNDDVTLVVVEIGEGTGSSEQGSGSSA
jgi:hypothetical protein